MKTIKISDKVATYKFLGYSAPISILFYDRDHLIFEDRCLVITMQHYFFILSTYFQSHLNKVISVNF